MVYAKVVEGNHRHEATSVACDYTGWERVRKSRGWITAFPGEIPIIWLESRVTNKFACTSFLSLCPLSAFHYLDLNWDLVDQLEVGSLSLEAATVISRFDLPRRSVAQIVFISCPHLNYYPTVHYPCGTNIPSELRRPLSQFLTDFHFFSQLSLACSVRTLRTTDLAGNCRQSTQETHARRIQSSRSHLLISSN